MHNFIITHFWLIFTNYWNINNPDTFTSEYRLSTSGPGMSDAFKLHFIVHKSFNIASKQSTLKWTGMFRPYIKV